MKPTKIEKGRQAWGRPSVNDPYAWATAALKRIRPEWEGDRHEKDKQLKWFPRGTGDAPPWGAGPFARGNEGAALRDRLAEEIVPQINEEHGWSPQGFNSLIWAAQNLISGKIKV